jgi:hypothetical protein
MKDKELNLEETEASHTLGGDIKYTSIALNLVEWRGQKGEGKKEKKKLQKKYMNSRKMHLPAALALAATCILAIASTSSAFSTSLVPSVLRSSAGACSFPRSLAPTSLVPAAASSLRVRAAPFVAMATKATVCLRVFFMKIS